MDLQVAPAELMTALPTVCIKTGLPADKLRPATFKYVPVASYALLALVFVGIFVRTHRRITVKLPVHKSAIAAQWKRVGIAMLVLLGGTGAFAGIGVATKATFWAAPAVVSLVAGLLMVVRQQNFMQGRLTKSGDLLLKDVSPIFIEQWRAMSAQRHMAAADAHLQAAQRFEAGPLGHPV